MTVNKGNYKVLVIVPPLKAHGGIANYYNSLKDKFGDNIEYFIRTKKNNIIIKVFNIIWIYIKLISKIKDQNYKIIHLNTSLDFRSLLRDTFIIKIAKHFNKKCVIFIRGWHDEQEKNVQKYFLNTINNTDACIVLSSKFKSKLLSWGYNKPIYVETTTVDDNYLTDYTPINIETKFVKDSDEINILFFARVEKYKGIFEALETYTLLSEKYKNIKLTIIGDGKEKNKVLEISQKNNLKKIVFKGFLTGHSKYNALKDGDILLFPSYSEGMPNSVLEAMACGLLIVTRNVGGVDDFFENEKMGFSTESKDPNVFVDLLEKLIRDKKTRLKISLYNYNFAKKNFYASIVAKRIEKIYNDIIN